MQCSFQTSEHEEAKCRYDWHQTASNVVIAIYAKMYHYEKSFIKINPVRLNVCLVFPQQNYAEFKLDLELRGVSIVNEMNIIFVVVVVYKYKRKSTRKNAKNSLVGI